MKFFVLLGAIPGGIIWQRVDAHQLSLRLDKVGEQLDARLRRFKPQRFRCAAAMRSRPRRIAYESLASRQTLGHESVREFFR
jgi:hypothetical protein